MSSGTSRRVNRMRHPPREWAARIALACGVAVLGYESVAFSVAQVAARSRPEAADEIVSYDGRLIAAHAASLMIPPITGEARANAAVLSRAALRRDPTAVSAATTLGVVTLAQNKPANARRLLAYAQMLSRRNAQTQMWSIEDAAERGDIMRALHWYDITLRTKPGMSSVLYPVLTQAAQDAAIRNALVHRLATKPLWADSYIDYAAGQKNDPQSTSALFMALHARGISVPASAQAAVINVLLNADNVDQAWRYYKMIRPGVNRTHSRDPRFTAMLETPSAFDWSTLSDNSLSASIQSTREGGTFDFSAPASIGGPVLQQVQLLPAGTYRLTGHSEGIAQDTRALPYWTLTCRRDGREFGRVIVPNSTQDGGHFAGTLSITGDCPVQVLTLIAQASDSVGGTSGQIDQAMLTPKK